MRSGAGTGGIGQKIEAEGLAPRFLGKRGGALPKGWQGQGRGAEGDEESAPGRGESFRKLRGHSSRFATV